MPSSSSLSHLCFLLSILSIVFFNSHLAASARCHIDDESGLLSFKSGITRDPSGTLALWKPGTDCCTWAGVGCGEGSRVTSLSLSGENNKPGTSFLTGTISPSLARVRNLAIIYIENNNLSGKIPDNIGNLTQLIALGFGYNRLNGPIPESISRLTELTQLRLGGNLLTGNIPEGIRNLKKLVQLSLEKNKLSGNIPNIFTSFPELRTLSLSHNKFSGEIPATVAALAPLLIYLELGHNNLVGKIPDFLGKFTTLDTLDLSGNRFTGTVPRSFANLTKIFNLDLSNNLLVDPFPELKIKGIESLDLSNNRFHLGQIPKWVTSSVIIYSLKLANCGIKMRLDDWKPVETYFYDYIDLSGNQITGSPVRLLNRTEFLVGFRAGGNGLRFDMKDLKIVKTLKQLDLSRNLVFGKLPATIAGLQELNVSYNHLCGKIPATKFPASAFLGNDCLCGSPLPACKR